MRLLYAVLLLVLVTTAFAQEQPFVPYTINERQHNAILNELGNLFCRSNETNKIAQFFVQAEQQAQQQAAQAYAKPDEHKP